MSLAPDGLALLFDHFTATTSFIGSDGALTTKREAITTSHLWLLSPPATTSVVGTPDGNKP